MIIPALKDRAKFIWPLRGPWLRDSEEGCVARFSVCHQIPERATAGAVKNDINRGRALRDGTQVREAAGAAK